MRGWRWRYAGLKSALRWNGSKSSTVSTAKGAAGAAFAAAGERNICRGNAVVQLMGSAILPSMLLGNFKGGCVYSWG